jgi:MFS family permease
MAGPNRQRQLGTLFLTLFTSILGLSILFPVLGPLGRHLGLSETEIGGTSTAYALAQLLFAPFWGRRSEKVGRRPMLILGVVGFALGFVALGVVVVLGDRGILTGHALLGAMLLARFVGGALSSAVLPTAQAYVADVTPPEERTRGMAVIGAAFGLAIICGPGIGAVTSHFFGLLAPIAAACVVGALNLALVVVLLPEPERRQHVTRPPASSTLLSRLRPVLLAGFVITTAAVLMEQTIAFLVQDVLSLTDEETPAKVGVALVAYGVVAVLTQGVLVRRVSMSPRTMLLMGMPITAIGLLLLGVADGFGLLIFATALQGLGQGLVQPGTTSMVSLLAHDDEQGTAAGLGSSASSLGRLVGPLLGPALYELHRTFPYYVSAALLFATVIAILLAVPAARPRTASV